MQPFRHIRPGQSLVIFALFAVVLFLFVGVGIDSSLLYVERRHLQNTADAACLAAATDLAMGQTSAVATTTANTYITNNLDNNAALLLDRPNLARTVVVNGSDVRVTLSGPAFTTFMRAASVNSYNVMARTHCDATHGGGVIPIAVVRFPGYDKNGTKRLGMADTSKTLAQSYGNGKKPAYLTILDVLQKGSGILNQVNNASQTPATMTGCAPADDSKRNWYDWNAGPHDDLTNHTGIYHDACTAASLGNPGPDVVMAGSGSSPNIGTASFRGEVVLDARWNGAGWQFYNTLIGSASSLNAWKSTVFSYIYNNYPGPDVPIGANLGILNGNSSGPLMSAISGRYKVNDVVTALVYDGTVHQLGDFQMSISCPADSTNPNCNSTASIPGKYISRPAPPSPLFENGGCKYVADPFVAVDGTPVSTAHLKNGSFHPAKYTVHLSNTASSFQTILLAARISGPDGTGVNFGAIQVRWTVGAGTPTVWQAPSAAQSVGLNSGASVDVQLEVIQTATKSVTCAKDGIAYTVPDHVYGAQTIQVTAQSASALHSGFGVLGMYNQNTSPNFLAGDYFLSFANDPVATVASGTASSIDAQLQFIDANSDPNNETELTCTTSPIAVDCSGASTTISGLGSGMQGSIVQGPGGAPVLRITTDNGTLTPEGTYTIDVRWNTTPAHSTRFVLSVVAPSSPSVKSWVTVVCYARFKITYMDSNQLNGRAVSGCIDPTTNPASLLSTSRMRPW